MTRSSSPSQEAIRELSAVSTRAVSAAPVSVSKRTPGKLYMSFSLVLQGVRSPRAKTSACDFGGTWCPQPAARSPAHTIHLLLYHMTSLLPFHGRWYWVHGRWYWAGVSTSFPGVDVVHCKMQ